MAGQLLSVASSKADCRATGTRSRCIAGTVSCAVCSRIRCNFSIGKCVSRRFKDMSNKAADKRPVVVDVDQFDSVLKRLIEHKPTPKKSIKASRQTKRGKILSKEAR